ncbi:MAG TPA: 4'-phosphopantetheinyl transferase superfamily protein [Bacteroidales bacterium]|nr:4'-phosphopantetheinyl transferase superfamily protein [Bacteroidales bacterium]HSA42470.1 4'-phosphopantetheinyl transferase superfamily protein [Bacteroidales bacterium]
MNICRFRQISLAQQAPSPAMAAGNLPPAKYRRYMALQRNEDRLRMWEAHRLLIDTLDSQFTLNHALIQYVEQPGKKPYLPGQTGIRFNLAHSGTLAALALSESETGIDIEEIVAHDHLSQTARVFMSDTEWVTFNQLPENESLRFFYRIWTLKESLLKNMGTGILDNLRAYSFDLDGKSPLVRLNGKRLRGYHFFEIDINPAYAASVCSCSPDPLVMM